jgi:hypothetical protein
VRLVAILKKKISAQAHLSRIQKKQTPTNKKTVSARLVANLKNLRPSTCNIEISYRDTFEN